MAALLGCAAAQSLSRPGVGFLGDLVAVALGEFGEVRVHREAAG
jgi:hypothetical protein